MARAKKSYGQHFLKDDHICENIAHHILSLENIDLIVEVGPGRGALTKFLYNSKTPFLAVEADKDVFFELFQNLPDLKKEQVILQDFLKFDLEQVIKGKRVALVGNFPYNISTQIVFKLLDHTQEIHHLVGMFQREVSDRIISPHGSKAYGILSVLTAVHYTGSTIMSVGPEAFTPPPRVNSSVIHLAQKTDKPILENPVMFKRVVKAAFGNRRKMIRNSIKSLGIAELDTSDSIFDKRPEQMALSDFIDMTKMILQHGL